MIHRQEILSIINDINKIIENLAEGKYTHDYPLTVEIMKELNILVNNRS